jgi:GNAT superfamily N-acetyltransferase
MRPPAAIEPFKGNQDTMATIARLHLEVRRWQVKMGYANFFDGILNSQADLNNISGYYIKPGGNFWTARISEEKEGIVGFVGLRKDNEHEAQLKRLAVLPEHQGQGIGSLLVAALVNHAREIGIRTINLSTGRQETARPIYERAGFIEFGIDELNDDYLMSLCLPKSTD